MSHAVGRTVYFTDLATTTDSRPSRTSDGLYWSTLTCWGRVAGIERVSLGLELDLRPQLSPYKRTFGSKAVVMPVRGALQAPLGGLLRRYRPAVHSRLVGS
jgi:hypothetical protein